MKLLVSIQRGAAQMPDARHLAIRMATGPRRGRHPRYEIKSQALRR